jgi:hypothetical protein
LLILSQSRKVLAKFALSSLLTVRAVRKEVTVDSLFSEKENIGGIEEIYSKTVSTVKK